MCRSFRLLMTLLLGAALAACGGAASPGTPTGEVPSATASPAVSSGTSAPVSPSQPASSASVTASASPSTLASPSAGETMVVRNYYFMEDASGGNPGLVPVERVVPKSVAVARAALTTLLVGPTAAERAAKPPITTLIPDGTQLLGIDVAGGTATVDLSGTFTSNNAGFSAGGRMAQVVYTLTQFPTVQRVAFTVDGKATTGTPSTRATYRDTYQPPMFVDGPAWGAALSDGERVSGEANVFEAQFRLALLDANGKTLLDRPVHATCGTGCWGTFSLTVPYTTATAQTGTLRVWDPSAKDGTPQNVREYPVQLAP